MDLFKSIKWAKNGDVTDMSQTNYEAGWSHLGDDTPTVEDFNLVQKLNDEKDQWLFNQIKAVCDEKGIEIAESDKQALLKAINTSATLSRAGITQLSSALDSTLETMAATPKAIKTLKDLIDAITRNLGNYIPNSKKSNAVDSNSSDTVATSYAVSLVNENANQRILRDGAPHRIALSWKSSGLNAQVDEVELGSIVFENTSPVFIDVLSSDSKKLSKTHQEDATHVNVTTQNFGGIIINRGNDTMLIESGSNHFDFIRRAKNGGNIYVISTQEKSGTVALLEDLQPLENNINQKLNTNNLDAGRQFIRAFGTYIIGGGGTAGGNNTSINNFFSVAFPTECVAVIPVHYGTDSSANIIVEYDSISRFGFKAKTNHRLNSTIQYIAIGY